MDTSKFLPAEFGSTTDSKKLFFAFGPGDIKQISTVEDMQHEIDLKTEEIVEELTEEVDGAVANALAAGNYANNKGQYALTQGQAAETAANAANAVANDLVARRDAGEFNGPPGPQGIQGIPGNDGKDGADGVVVTITGQFMMQIKNDHLFVQYPDNSTPPDMYIDPDTGHLKWDY